jgi:transcriptional regulator with XRE-family HTH domain
MGRKKGSQTTTVISGELHARIVSLANLLWHGNRSRMGRDLGVDQSALSKVLAGKQQPSATLLERCANWPAVNPAWLMCGRGEPLLDGSPAPGAGLYRPLLEELPPCRLSELPALRAGVSYPIAGAHYTETSYWFRVPANHPITFGNEVTRGDLLLMETDPQWTSSIERVRGNIVVFGDPEGSDDTRRTLIGLIDASDEPTYGDYRAVSELYAIRLYTGKHDRAAQKSQPTRAWLVLPGDRKAVREAAAKLKEPVFTLEDILAVRVNLTRPAWTAAHRRL